MIELSGIADWSQFWIAFWSSLAAGAIDSLLVGFIVGVMILVFQWRIDKRRLQHKCEREVATFQEQLRFTLNQQQVRYVDSLIKPYSIVEPLVKLFSDFPLDLWLENVPRQEKLINTIKEFQAVYSSFNLIANKLQVKLSSAIRLLYNKEGIMSANDEMLLTFFIGRTIGMEASVILPWVGAGDNSSPQFITAMEGRYKLLLENVDVKVLTAQYLIDRQNLEKAIEKLRVTIAQPILPKQNRVRLLLRKLRIRGEKLLHRPLK